jgi:hypothetical protein
MTRKLTATITGLIVLAVLIVGMAQLNAQRPGPREEGPPAAARPGFFPAGPVGRYMVARLDGSNIILLDTTTGDLYVATPKDFKKFSERPRGPAFGPPTFERAPRERPPAPVRPRIEKRPDEE